MIKMEKQFVIRRQLNLYSDNPFNPNIEIDVIGRVVIQFTPLPN